MAEKAEKRVEKAVVVAFVAHGISSEMHHDVGAQELNKLLDDGWTVKSVHPMSSAGGNAPLLCFASIVIVSKSG